MRRAEAFLLGLLALAPAGADLAEAEAALGPKAPALRELLVGAPLSDRQRDNKVKRLAELLADPKALEKALREQRERALEANRREALKTLASAFAVLLPNPDAAEALVRQAEKARDAWEKARKAGGGEVDRLRNRDREARLQWLRRQGLTRPGADALAAAYVFCDEDFVPVPPGMLAFLQKRGFDARDAEILVYELELRAQILHRMEAEVAGAAR